MLLGPRIDEPLLEVENGTKRAMMAGGVELLFADEPPLLDRH
jgi:hypothetical protein